MRDDIFFLSTDKEMLNIVDSGILYSRFIFSERLIRANKDQRANKNQANLKVYANV